MNKQQLAAKIWESANRMRSKIEAYEYKDYILGFIFYKFISDKEINWLIENGCQNREEAMEELQNEEIHSEICDDLGYVITYENLFQTWLDKGLDFGVDDVRLALSKFSDSIEGEKARAVFGGIFNTLETGLSKLGENTQAQNRAVRELVHLIKDIPTDGKQGYDVLGYVYEYLIEKFASNAGKKAGEFYTPHEVSALMAEIVADHLKGCKEINVYDPTSGSGSLLLNIGEAWQKYENDKNAIHYYAQELNTNTYNLTRMNLVMRDVNKDNITVRNGDTLDNDWPIFDEVDPVGTYQRKAVSAVVSNPPYSQSWDPSKHDGDPRYSEYGYAPKAKADYAFLLHDLYHLEPEGIMTIVLPHGVLFRGGEEGRIRTNLIEKNNIDTIIGLPANIFFGTGIPTIVIVLKKNKTSRDILFIDASKGFIKEGKSNKLRACDIRKIVDTVRARVDIEKYSRLVGIEEIRKNDYNLNIPRYVDSSEDAESWDIYASMFGGIPESELKKFAKYFAVFDHLKEELFHSDGNYANLVVETDQLPKILRENQGVQKFQENYREKFADFTEKLSNNLIDHAESVRIQATEEDIVKDIFERLSDIPLVDKYEVYEIFKKAYGGIAGDLENIQKEGINAVRMVDPNMVLRKKNNREEEQQDGWKGHILPFDLVQKVLLKDKLAEVEEKKNRLAEIPSRIEEIFEELSEDDKESISETLNEDNTAFVIKTIPAMIKALKSEDSEESKSLVEKLEEVDALTKEEKKLKSEIKAGDDALHLETRDRIENLSGTEVVELLQQKWIVPIYDEIIAISIKVVDEFKKGIEALVNKYADTFEDLEKEIQDTQDELSKMLGELTGSEADLAGIRELQKLLSGREH